jgi:hypothetical protein
MVYSGWGFLVPLAGKLSIILFICRELERLGLLGDWLRD